MVYSSLSPLIESKRKQKQLAAKANQIITFTHPAVTSQIILGYEMNTRQMQVHLVQRVLHFYIYALAGHSNCKLTVNCKLKLILMNF